MAGADAVDGPPHDVDPHHVFFRSAFFGLPAARSLGPMISGIIFAANGVKLTIPRWPYLGAQAVIWGNGIGRITPAIVATLGDHSWLFGIITVATLLGSAIIGGWT